MGGVKESKTDFFKVLNKIFQKATTIAKDLGDEFISLEHLFLAMIAGKDKVSTIRRIALMS